MQNLKYQCSAQTRSRWIYMELIWSGAEWIFNIPTISNRFHKEGKSIAWCTSILVWNFYSEKSISPSSEIDCKQFKHSVSKRLQYAIDCDHDANRLHSMLTFWLCNSTVWNQFEWWWNRFQPAIFSKILLLQDISSKGLFIQVASFLKFLANYELYENHK